MSGSGSRIRELDGLRGCAIAAVFVHHAFGIKLLWMGVDLFFVLSGFLITGILMNQRDRPFREFIGGFYARRVRRILPPYAILLAIAVVAFHGPWMRYWYLYFGAMNFIIPLHLDCAPIVSPLWSLAVEEQFYLVWPLAIYALSRRQMIRFAIALMVLAPLLRFVCTPYLSSSRWVYMLLPFRMDTLAAGALVALLWPEMKRRLAVSPGMRSRLMWGSVGVAILSLTGVLALKRFGMTTDSNTPVGNMWIYEGTLGMMASVFLMTLLGAGRRFFTAAPLLYLGQISYSFYLIHQVALEAIPQMHGLVAFTASIAYATVLWYAVERPLLRVKKPQPAMVAVA